MGQSEFTGAMELFREQCQFLLIDRPYSMCTEPAHIAVVLNSMAPHSYQIFNNLMFPEDKDKKKHTDVLEVLGGHFKPTQSVFKAGINVVMCPQVNARIKQNF